MDNRRQYLVQYRPDSDTKSDAMVVRAWKVEGWNNDYAFYGHYEDRNAVTFLVPRSIVKGVKMDYDADGRLARSGNEPTPQAQKRWESGKPR